MCLFRKIQKIEFVRNVTTLLSGNVLAQAITIGAAPIVTRLFSPAEFGLFALFVAIVSVVTKVGSLCYERAILLPASDSDAAAVLLLSMLILVGLAGVIAGVALAFGEDIAGLLGNADLADWILLVPFIVLVIGAGNVLRYWAMRCKVLRLIAVSGVIEAMLSAGTKISLGFIFGSWVGGLVAGIFISGVAALLLLSISLYRIGKGSSLLAGALKRVRGVAWSYRQFPLFASWTALLSVISTSMAVFFLSAFFGAVIVGFYNLAQRILAQPIATLANSVARVYFLKSASQLTNRQKLIPGLKKTMLVLVFIGVIPFSVLGIFGPEIFSLVFGDKWTTAGEYAQILTPWFFMTFLLAPAAIVFEVCKQQKKKLWINAATVGLGLGILIFLQKTGGSVELIIAGFVAVNVIMSIVQIAFALRIAADHDRSLKHA